MSQVLFSGGDGNGVYSEDCTATANDILKGKTALFNGSDDEVVEGTLELTGTAVDNQVLAGKTYYSTDAHTKRTGTIQSQPGWTPIPSTAQQILDCKGKYMTENVVIPAFIMPSANVIKAGATVSIYGQSVTGTWEGYSPTTEYFWKATPGGNSNIGGLVGTGNLGFGSLGQVYSNSNASDNKLSTPTMINLRKYSRIFVHINKSEPFEDAGVAIYARYANGQRALMRSFIHYSTDGAFYYYDYNASWWATLELVFTRQGTGLWQWGIQYIE